jgi:hypothetical protein
MEVDVTTQQNNESIKTKSDQFMEEWIELDFERILNYGSLLVQETFAPTKQASKSIINMYKIGSTSFV